MNFKSRLFCLAFIVFTLAGAASARGGDAEYIGQFDSTLAANVEDMDKIVFNFVPSGQLKSSRSFGENAHLALTKIYNPQTEKNSLPALLVETSKDTPVVFIDANGDGDFGDNEKFTFAQEKEDNPYLWVTTVDLPVKDGFFKTCPIFLRYFKEIQMGKMTADDRLMQQTTGVFARGTVDVKGKRVPVQYAYSFADKKVNPQKGWLGIDADGDGKIDMDNLSPEAAKASDETVVFRVGETYLSTKKTDVQKNQIVLRENQAKDYKRYELAIGKEMPDFDFTDLTGKKHRLSEFRGKFIILDFWGLWCPACRDEVPYLRESYKRYQSRNFEIIGMNTDPFPPDQIKSALDKSGVTWTQAKLESIYDLINANLRIESFPSTMLISPEGKILSMSRSDRDELDLRGKDLLTTLNKILPPEKGTAEPGK